MGSWRAPKGSLIDTGVRCGNAVPQGLVMESWLLRVGKTLKILESSPLSDAYVTLIIIFDNCWNILVCA